MAFRQLSRHFSSRDGTWHGMFVSSGLGFGLPISFGRSFIQGIVRSIAWLAVSHNSLASLLRRWTTCVPWLGFRYFGRLLLGDRPLVSPGVFIFSVGVFTRANSIFSTPWGRFVRTLSPWSALTCAVHFIPCTGFPFEMWVT